MLRFGNMARAWMAVQETDRKTEMMTDVDWMMQVEKETSEMIEG